MAITLIIKGTSIEIPSSAQGPNWAPGIIEALSALTDAINGVTGTYDVPPQVQNIDANNSSSNVDVDDLVFPVSEVRSATIFYSVHRQTEDSGSGDQEEVSEGGIITIVYNASNSTNNKWEIAQQKAGEADISFTVTDLGQVQFSTTALTGINHTGKISYRAVAVLND
jgi:hypothetical protein